MVLLGVSGREDAVNQDKVKRLVEQHKATLVEMAHSQSERAIGEAAVQLHARGQAISKDALIAHLLEQVQGGQTLEREMHEHAARLLGWEPAPPA